MDYSRFKSKARENLTGNWLVLVVIAILVMIVTNSDVGNTTSYVRNGVNFEVRRNFGSILNLIFGGPVLLGVANVYLELSREGRARFERFLDGFKRFADAFILNIVTTLFIVLWALLFIIPGIIAAIRYSMAYLIMSENPDVGPMEAINLSKRMMDGHKTEFFSFVLSFFGWFILGIVTFGLGFLFLSPYYNASKVEFYRALKGEGDGDYEYVVESKPVE